MKGETAGAFFIGLLVGMFLLMVLVEFSPRGPDGICDSECKANQHDRGEWDSQLKYCKCYDRSEE